MGIEIGWVKSLTGVGSSTVQKLIPLMELDPFVWIGSVTGIDCTAVMFNVPHLTYNIYLGLQVHTYEKMAKAYQIYLWNR